MSALLLFALLIGIRHTLEPDHLAAVLAVSAQSNSITATARQGAIWGIGHTITLFVFSMLLLGMQIEIDKSIFLSLELLVGLVLILMGIDVINNTRILFSKKFDRYSATSKEHNRGSLLTLKALGIGLLHGAAGSGVIIAIVSTTIDSIYLKFAYIALFSVGLIFSMALLSMLVSMPAQRRINLISKKQFKIIIGSVGIIIGLHMLYTSGLQMHTLV